MTIVFGKSDTFTAYLDDTGTFSTVITPLRRPASTYAVVATDRYGFGAQAPGGFLVPCPTVPTPTVTQTTSTTRPTTDTTPSTGTTTTLPPPPVEEPRRP